MRVSFTKESVISLAHGSAIDPGIVVGRLQKEGIIKYNQLNDLKTKYGMTA